MNTKINTGLNAYIARRLGWSILILVILVLLISSLWVPKLLGLANIQITNINCESVTVAYANNYYQSRLLAGDIYLVHDFQLGEAGFQESWNGRASVKFESISEWKITEGFNGPVHYYLPVKQERTINRPHMCP